MPGTPIDCADALGELIDDDNLLIVRRQLWSFF
jgi:hypothetical protein